MRSFIILLTICVAAVVSPAQQTATVSGRAVWGTSTRSGVDMAVLRLTSDSDPTIMFETTADGEGNFRFENIPLGNYRLIADGADPAVRSRGEITINVSADNIAAVEIVVYVVGTPETVSVAAGEPQTIDQVSKTVDVIGGREMRERADFTLVESLRSIPGLRVQQLGGFGRAASIKTRGLRNQDTAVLIDGIRFRDASSINGDASSFLSDITLSSVSRVEVLRGSGSSLYGTNAIGGVIDFRTPSPTAGTHGQLSGNVGGYGLTRFRANLSHGRANGRFGIGGGISRTVYTKGLDGNDNARNTSLQIRANARPTSASTNISARLYFTDAKVRLNTDPDTYGILPTANSTIVSATPGVNFVPDVDDPDDEQRSSIVGIQIAADQRMNDKLLIVGYYQVLDSIRRNMNGPLGVGFQSAATSTFKGNIQTANAHVNWSPFDNKTITGGFEFESESFENDGSTPDASGNFFTRVRQQSGTTYVQALIGLFEGRLQLSGGLRAQIFSLGRPIFSLANAPYDPLVLSDPPAAFTADGSASYFIENTGTKFRAHVGNGYRVPSLYERFGTFFSNFGVPSFVAIGDPFLKPERSIAFDAGIDQELMGENLRISASYFYTMLNKVIGYGNVVPDIGSTPRPFGGYENQEGGIARGAEFSVKASPTDSTDLLTSYTYTNSDQRTPQVSGSGVIRSLGIPEHQFTFVATQRVKRFWVNFDLLVSSSYLAPIFSSMTFQTYVYRFAGNRKGDLTAGYTFGLKKGQMSLRVYGTIENIFDNEYYENGFRTFKRYGRLGATFVF